MVNVIAGYDTARRYYIERSQDRRIFVYNCKINKFCEVIIERKEVKDLYSIVKVVNGRKNIFMFEILPYCITIELNAIGGRWQKSDEAWEKAASRLLEANIPLYLIKKAVKRAFPLDAKRLDDGSFDPFDWRKPSVKKTRYEDDPLYKRKFNQMAFFDSDVLPSSCDDRTAASLSSDDIKICSSAGNGFSFACVPPKIMRKKLSSNPLFIYLQTKTEGGRWKTVYKIQLGDSPSITVV